ncbi:asparagine synthetase B family protein [methane-oxidizing endosymbiont of Gigantopelta aegis]|uniref:asparagine synthetase B family protein n=1 Tax=methane-oxidizing endosymbiont of Gigantopelta aegis TaxID=2794938 RepID=UPI0018DE0FCD|nr:asparagine synthase C-terminal domain-containing protein [methane-oxidizing endosymbiont of Gigantopelta aegis]
MTQAVGWINTTTTDQDADGLLTRIINRQEVAKQTSKGMAIAAEHSRFFQQDGCVLINLDGCDNQEKEQIIRQYQQQETAFIDSYRAEHSFILLDMDQQTVVLVTDGIGKSNIFYAQTASGLVFGTSADFVIAHPDVSDEISAQTVYDYVYFHHCPSPNTIYKQVKKLENAQVLIVEKGNITVKNYWLPHFQEKLTESVEDAGKHLQALLTEAVRKNVDKAEDTGAFLSGGLDSSSVSGALSKVFPGQAKTFSMGFPVEGYDEIEYARTAVKHFNTRQHEYYLTPEDTVKAIPDIADYYDEPFGNSSALAAYYCAKMAKENGVNILLAGDGGDELFAGNERYAKQLLFDYYFKAPKPLRSALEAFLKTLPASLADKGLFFKAKRYIEQAKEPMPDRLQDYNFLHRHDNADIFQSDFLQQVDTREPLNLLRESYQRPDEASMLNRMLYMDWKTTLHDNDLVKVNRMCEMAGIEVRYPLLDQTIVNFSTQIPSTIKLNGQKLRWFYKQAFTDFLPEKIINKPKHGFGLPFGIWLKDYQPLKELAYDSINSLKKRLYFKSEFLDHAIKMHQSIHAAYYGELIWILMMLELWFQSKEK